MSRQDVLALLREQEGAFVSGEEISHRLGLSRAAIWKAVDALRREGYTVEARTGRGYRLLDAPDVLTEPEIRRFLGETARVGRTLVCLAEVDSTNLRARQLAAEGAADGTVVVADRQTAGRGRLGRSFQSPGGQGIYLTALLRPDLPPERLSPVTAMAGVAVCRAVERLCGVSPGLKWPNDPVLDGKKLCGILTELSLEGETARVQELVLGIGINVSQRPEDFTPEVREIATSLVQALGHAVSRPALAAEIIREVDSPRLKLLYDIYHMQLMEGDLANTIRANADIIGYIHIGDVPGRHEPGTGEINYPFLKHLLVDELKFDGIFAFELSPLTTLDACVEAMHAF